MFINASLIYPVSLHKEHSELPMAIEKKIVSYEDLSPFSKKVYNYSHPKKQKKFLKVNSFRHFIIKISTHYTTRI